MGLGRPADVEHVLVLRRLAVLTTDGVFLLPGSLPTWDQDGDDSPEWAHVRHGAGLIAAVPLGLLSWAAILTPIWVLA